MSDSRVRSVNGRALPLVGDEIDTDRIMPARHLRAITFDGLEHHLFGDDRQHAAAQGLVHPVDDPRFAGATLMVVNRNFGCGSSREHAPQGILRWGIRGIIGESFSEIFFGNSVMLGMPAVTAAPADVAALQAAIDRDPRLEVRLDPADGIPARGDAESQADDGEKDGVHAQRPSLAAKVAARHASDLPMMNSRRARA